jgi:uncharacterized membrane protein
MCFLCAYVPMWFKKSNSPQNELITIRKDPKLPLKLTISLNISRYTTLVLLLALAFFTVLMAQITVNYLPYNTDVGFLRIKQQYIDIDHWRLAFFIHVYASIWVLLAGFSQFSKRLLKRRPVWHRRLGYVYVLNILCITGPASLVMGFYANGGTGSRIAFVLLAVLWLYFTVMALYHARRRNFKTHRHFMMRSYALTLSALTLRAWKYLITNTVELPPMDVYRMVAWLGWVLNLAVAEWMIWREGWRNGIGQKGIG